MILSNVETGSVHLENCQLCPRDCRTNRLLGKLGYCKAGAGFEIASITAHHGEEPVISGKKGICNIFFSHCNLQCIYCQNYQISHKGCLVTTPGRSLEQVTQSIIGILDEGAESLGFVSPTHMVPQMKEIIRAVHREGFHPYIIYNTNSYDSVEILKSLEEWVDVYLPDFKYMDPALAKKWSDAADYPEMAGKAIREMYRQKGNVLRLNENGIAENGLLVRHLVLPGAVENSIEVLRFLAEEVSARISISLMSQYNPTAKVSGVNPLNRKIRYEEYKEVVEELDRLGFSKGWVQDHESADLYNPDFNSELPFAEL